MIEFNPETRIATCLDCNFTWKVPLKASNKYGPKRCSKCFISAFYYRKIKQYSTLESTRIEISPATKQRLIRKREFPSESFGSVIDRILQNKPSLIVWYDPKQKSKGRSIRISKKINNKLKKIKRKYGFKSVDETLWRLIDGQVR